MVERTPRTTAVVVTYHPDRGRLSALLQALASQARATVVVDNGSGLEIASWLKKEEAAGRIYLRLLGENIGVAAAQNCGIEFAQQLQSDYVVLFDHDSLPAPEMIPRLVMAAEQKAAEGYKVAAVGPRYVDPRQSNPPPFIRVLGLHLERRSCTSPDSVVEVDYLISSGCLIPMETIQDVGPMRNDLFIDYIDIEWGLRAKARGYQSFGVCGAEMFHSLGEEPIPFLGKKFPNHSPLRHYYHFRNAVHLYKESWAPLNWKLVDGWKLIQKFGFYSLFGKPRTDHFRMMTKGICHGLAGRTGNI
jgi:rhamnosyltransferase